MPAVPPNRWLGVLGGGQLGRMFAHAAQSLGYRVAVYCPNEAPASRVADRWIRGAYDDTDALRQLGELCDSVTTEFENVPAAALDFLSTLCAVSPHGQAVSVAQDRIAEKAFVRRCGVPTAPYAPIQSVADLGAADASLFPAVLKAARLGYDGKGQARVATRDEAVAAWGRLGGVPCVLEKRLDLAVEISVLLGRARDGSTMTWPVAENEHRGGILAVSTVPARVSPDLAARAGDMARRIAQELDYVGVLCIEFFGLADGSLVVNEMAPRPHNSGHHTIDSCVVSQFEQQARIMAGLPLGEPARHSAAVMVNLLGDIWQQGEPDWAVVARQPGARLHLYGKENARPGRKMGHVTVVAPTVHEAAAGARNIEAALGIG